MEHSWGLFMMAMNNSTEEKRPCSLVPNYHTAMIKASILICPCFTFFLEKYHYSSLVALHLINFTLFFKEIYSSKMKTNISICFGEVFFQSTCFGEVFFQWLQRELNSLKNFYCWSYCFWVSIYHCNANDLISIILLIFKNRCFEMINIHKNVTMKRELSALTWTKWIGIFCWSRIHDLSS